MKTINYAVSRNGIVPNSIQKGGIQGDHKMTELVFELDQVLYDELKGYETENKKLYYHFSCFDGVGNQYRIGLSNLVGKTVNYELEHRLTKFGGEIQISLVITLIESATEPISVLTARELYSATAKVSILSNPLGCDVDEEKYASLPTLVVGVNESVDKAIEAAAAAKQSEINASSSASSAADSADSALAEADRAKREADRAETAWVNALPIAATCYNEAAAEKPTTNDWFIPKIMEKPSVHNGMVVNVRWINGRVDGVGYDIRLIYGEPDGADNEIIIDSTSVIDAPSGMINIPTDGTIVYQLVIKDGRNHWKYISGDVLKASFSSSTSAAVADKLVPNLNTNYVPGMDIYVQLDNGNTADVMRLVPDEGEILPVYGNGTERKTGEIGKGYILHLKNAGDHWQILNGGNVTKGYVDSELTRPQHNTMVVSVHTEGIGVKADYKASEIKRHKDGGGVVLLNLDAALTQGTGEQTYLLETVKNGKAIFRRPVISTVNETVSRVIVTIDEKYNVEMTEDIIEIASKSYADNNFANALKTTANDITLNITDVSPITHKVKCHVESANQFTGILTSQPNMRYDEASNSYVQIDADNNPIITIKLQKYKNGSYVDIISNTTITTTGEVKIPIVKDDAIDELFMKFNGRSFDSGIKFKFPVTMIDGNYIITVNVPSLTQGSLAFKDLRINKNKSLPYTKYINSVDGIKVTQQPSGEVHTADAEGNMPDFISSYPSMEFSSDNAGAAIFVDYNRDIIKAIESIEQKLTDMAAVETALNEVI